MFDIDTKSIDILSSRDNIRDELVTYAKSYLELENVDLFYTSFLSYIINVLSILTANQLYYTSSIYREFFLTEAQMEESVYNLAKWIGYTPTTAQPATCNVVITIPLTFKDNDVAFMIPSDFTIKSDDIIYTVGGLPLTFQSDQTLIQSEFDSMDSEGIDIKVITNKAVTVRNAYGYFFPVLIDRTAQTASFIAPFTQYETKSFVYQVPEDLEIYQFWSVKLDFIGMPWKALVYEDITDNTGTHSEQLTQAEGNSLYTMTATEKQYVFNSTFNKAEIFFGNGVIGKQPTPGATIRVELLITKGEGGKVIAGTLVNPSKVYYTDTLGKTLPVKIYTNNSAPAEGGEDAPSISQIKSRAIANLRSKGRFVSSQDYDDLEEILPNTPLADAAPVLKRSDIKVNEIMLFTKLKYQDLICPTRNIVFPIDSTTYDIVVQGQEIVLDGEIYETMFTMDIDHTTDSVLYEYNVKDVNVQPVLESVTEWTKYCYIIITSVNLYKNGSQIEMTAYVTNIPDQITDFQCELTTGWDGLKYVMGNDIDISSNLVDFFHTFPNYLDIPLNEQQFKLQISGVVPGHLIGPGYLDTRMVVANYSFTAIIRKKLDNFMMSSLTTDSTTGIQVIHNVPVIETAFFEDQNVDRQSFELLTIQSLINNIDINSKRMLTDFINVKFADTTGKLKNMRYNDINRYVLSRSLDYIPPSPTNLDSYIVNGKEDLTWIDHINDVVIYYDTYGWTFYTPKVNDHVYILDEQKHLVFAGCSWVEPIFDIPFWIEATVNKDPTSTMSVSVMVENIKQALLNNFAPKFGMDKNMDRSEIIKVIRGVSGVMYVKLIKPEIDIRFTYKIPYDLPLIQLLDYTPQLVAFTYDTINIGVREESL